MADAQSTSNYPNLNPGQTTASGNGSLQNAKDSVVSNAQIAMDKVANHPLTQSVANGPVADKARVEAGKTRDELSNLVNSRQTPEAQTATGQELTHYHSMFYNLLSWENPRATTIAFASTIVFIFFTRYVPVTSYVLKGTYITLGLTAAAELAGKLVFDHGFVTKVRPRKYYTIPRESLEAMLEDVEQLINFFVIEAQRIVFAENVYVTIAAFATTLITYLFTKFVPKWGLALLGSTAVYILPLIYIRNQEVIDGHINNASEIIGQQTQQVRDLAAHHTSRAVEATKQTTSQYSQIAQDYIGQTKNKAASPEAPNPANLNPVKDEPEREIKSEQLPSAPTHEFDGPEKTQAEAGTAEPVLE